MRVEELISRNEKFALLVGAGISLDSPSNLLDGWNFMFEVLKRCAPTELDSFIEMPTHELKNSDLWKSSWILSILSQHDNVYARPGEQLRFEVLMGWLKQSGMDKELKVLDCLDYCQSPNKNHYLIANLIKNGNTVITTNFDTLIEQAYEELFTDGTPLKVAFMDEDFAQNGSSNKEIPILWKIHGSISHKKVNTKFSIQATYTSIRSKMLSENKSLFLKNVLRKADFYVLGYSGWDDLDIMPIICDTHSNKNLFWVEHKDLQAPIVKHKTEINRNLKKKYRLDLIGKNRLINNIVDEETPIRTPDNIFLISGNTSDILETITKTCYSNLSFILSKNDFRFGKNYPEEVQIYFDTWKKNLKYSKNAPFCLIHGIFTNKFNSRPEFKEYKLLTEDMISNISLEPSSNLVDVLENSIDLFNKYFLLSKFELIENLKSKLIRLDKVKIEQNKGLFFRILGCIEYSLGNRSTGIELFRKSASYFKEKNDDGEEFSTLSTWRNFVGFNQWEDLIIEETSDIKYFRSIVEQITQVKLLNGEYSMPQNEIIRWNYLGNKIGYQPIIWGQWMMSLMYVIDDDPRVYPILFKRLSTLRQESIYVGDILGEALATHLIGRIYLIEKQYNQAAFEFIRTDELHRILKFSEVLEDNNTYLNYCSEQIGLELINKVRKTVEESMWNI